MPCYQTGSREGDLALDAADSRKEVTRLTRLLCEAVEAIRTKASLRHCSAELQQWALEHDKIDAKRRAREEESARQKMLRRKALGKLTNEERAALNIRDKE